MSKQHGDAAGVFKEVVAPPSVISFETFIGSLEHGSIISGRKENDSEECDHSFASDGFLRIKNQYHNDN